MLKRSPTLTSLLEQTLTRSERDRILEGALRLLLPEQLDHLTREIGEATGSTLCRALEAFEGKSEVYPKPGSALLEQRWADFFREFGDLLEAADDEHGDWVAQDEPWSEPYFYDEDFSEELDRWAGRARKLLSEILEAGMDLDKDMLDFLTEKISEVGAGLPEWIPGGDEVALGPEGLHLILEWEGHRAAATPAAIAGRLAAREREAGRSLTYPFVPSQVFLSLPENQQRELLQEMATGGRHSPWPAMLASGRGAWYELHFELTQRFDRSSHLDACRRGISSDWTRALPLVEEFAQREQHQEVLEVLEAALGTLCRCREEFVLSRQLLARHLPGYQREERLRCCRQLLDHGETAADNLGDAALTWTFGTQAKLLETWRDWDQVLDVLRRGEGSEGVTEAREALFETWKRCALGSCSRWSGEGTWLDDLITARWRGSSRAAFRDQVRSRLELRSGNFFGILRLCREPLSLLACLFPEEKLSEISPGLPHLVKLELKWEGIPEVSFVRRWLHDLGADPLREEAMAALGERVLERVPDPGSVENSRYASHAAWMSLALDLRPEPAAALLEDWRRRYKRRRNLWAALGEFGLE